MVSILSTTQCGESSYHQIVEIVPKVVESDGCIWPEVFLTNIG